MKTTTTNTLTGMLAALVMSLALGMMDAGAQTPWPTKNAAKTTLDGTEVIIINDGGPDEKATVDNLFKGRLITDGLTASGSTANDFSGSTGTFLTSTGANTLGGAVTIAAATTPSLTTASGKTNTGFLQVNGKTSGALKLTAADAAGQTVTVSLAAQTSGAATLTINDLAGVGHSVMVSSLTTNTTGAANSVTGASNALVFEGATADGSEISLTPADATADVVYLLADAAAGSYALMGSTLATNAPDIANSVYGVSNGLMFEGATADGNEIRFTPADATADVVYLLADAAAGSYSVMSSTLATNAPDIANSVYGVSNGLMFEGATADGNEIRFTPADATADVVYLLADAAAGSYSVMSSTLATNAPNIANSVTGASAALVFEGTADAHETSLTVTDPTADRTATLPNATGTVHLAQASTAVSLTGDDQAVTPGANTVIQLSSDNNTASNRTFTLSATGAITGQIYVIIGPASNACELADTGIQKLSAAWSPAATDTLTVIFDGTNFIELSRADN